MNLGAFYLHFWHNSMKLFVRKLNDDIIQFFGLHLVIFHGLLEFCIVIWPSIDEDFAKEEGVHVEFSSRVVILFIHLDLVNVQIQNNSLGK